MIALSACLLAAARKGKKKRHRPGGGERREDSHDSGVSSLHSHLPCAPNEKSERDETQPDRRRKNGLQGMVVPKSKKMNERKIETFEIGGGQFLHENVTYRLTPQRTESSPLTKR